MIKHTITKYWDNTSIPITDNIDLELEYVKNQKTDKNDLQIKISAPFYDDPKLPINTSVGSMDKLWEYEVVEVFLLGEDDHYLEIELGPKGQYLLLELHGSRNVTEKGLTLTQYITHTSNDRWTGLAVIPSVYLPKNIQKFNAYAIHGSNDNRKYLSLFPANNTLKAPDFHKLEFFGNFDLK